MEKQIAKAVLDFLAQLPGETAPGKDLSKPIEGPDWLRSIIDPPGVPADSHTRMAVIEALEAIESGKALWDAIAVPALPENYDKGRDELADWLGARPETRDDELYGNRWELVNKVLSSYQWIEFRRALCEAHFKERVTVREWVVNRVEELAKTLTPEDLQIDKGAWV